MDKSAYDFRIDRSKELAAEAERAVNRIYGAGLMFRGNVLGAGGNNVLADNAANAFTRSDLFKLQTAGDAQAKLMGRIIQKRQEYAAGDFDKKSLEADNVLLDIYVTAQALKKAGWTPESEPARMSYSGPAPKP